MVVLVGENVALTVGVAADAWEEAGVAEYDGDGAVEPTENIVGVTEAVAVTEADGEDVGATEQSRAIP